MKDPQCLFAASCLFSKASCPLYFHLSLSASSSSLCSLPLPPLHSQHPLSFSHSCPPPRFLDSREKKVYPWQQGKGWELEEKGGLKACWLVLYGRWEKCWYGGIGNILISDTFDHVYRKYKVMHVMSFGENTTHCLLYEWIHLSWNGKMVMLP